MTEDEIVTRIAIALQTHQRCGVLGNRDDTSRDDRYSCGIVVKAEAKREVLVYGWHHYAQVVMEELKAIRNEVDPDPEDEDEEPDAAERARRSAEMKEIYQKMVARTWPTVTFDATETEAEESSIRSASARKERRRRWLRKGA